MLPIDEKSKTTAAGTGPVAEKSPLEPRANTHKDNKIRLVHYQSRGGSHEAMTPAPA